MPPLPNANSGSSYPPVPNQPFGVGAGYPPVQQQFHHSNPNYPQQSQFPTPGVGFGSGYPPMPNAPQAGGYPQQQMPTAYPSAQPPAAGYPSQTNQSYPYSQGYSGHAGFQQSSSSSTPSYGYPSMVSVFNEMKGHIKDTRKSKVCVCIISLHTLRIRIMLLFFMSDTKYLLISENTNNNNIIKASRSEKNHTINA